MDVSSVLPFRQQYIFLEKTGVPLTQHAHYA
jgi:hypothetical protein